MSQRRRSSHSYWWRLVIAPERVLIVPKINSCSEGCFPEEIWNLCSSRINLVAFDDIHKKQRRRRSFNIDLELLTNDLPFCLQYILTQTKCILTLQGYNLGQNILNKFHSRRKVCFPPFPWLTIMKMFTKPELAWYMFNIVDRGREKLLNNYPYQNNWTRFFSCYNIFCPGL